MTGSGNSYEQDKQKQREEVIKVSAFVPVKHIVINSRFDVLVAPDNKSH